MVHEVIGGAIAFFCAVAATYLDCYQVLREKAWRVPAQFWKSIGLGLLAAGCGALAVGAFVYSLSGDTGFIDVVLGAAVPNLIARGFYTGFAVLALIRSKVFQVKGADIGAEYAYKELRAICLRGINVAATGARARYLNDNLKAILAALVSDNDLEQQCQQLVRAAVANADEKTLATVESQLAKIQTDKPPGAPNATDRAWSTYARALVSLVLENCGVAPFKKLIGR